MEYTKQLLLSCLLNVCHKLSPEGGAVGSGRSAEGLQVHQRGNIEHYCSIHPFPQQGLSDRQRDV